MAVSYKHVALLTAGLVLSLQAQAQASEGSSPWSAEVGYMALSFTNKDESDGSKMKANSGMLSLSVGYRVHPHIVVEGLLGLGATKGKVKWDGVESGYRIKTNMYGVFVRPTVSLNEQVELFGRVGYLQARVSEHDGVENASYSGGRFSYGFGMNYNLSKTSYLQATWTKGVYKDKEEPNFKASAIGLAYGMRF